MKAHRYEQLVARVAGAVIDHVEGAGSAKIAFGRSSTVAGASGYRHQVDVVAETPEALLLLECKCWRRRVGVPALLTFAARVADIRQARTGQRVTAGLATKVGFQKGAQTLAQHYEISTDLVRGADDFVIRYKDSLNLGIKGQELTVEQGRLTLLFTPGTDDPPKEPVA